MRCATDGSCGFRRWPFLTRKRIHFISRIRRPCATGRRSSRSATGSAKRSISHTGNCTFRKVPIPASRSVSAPVAAAGGLRGGSAVAALIGPCYGRSKGVARTNDVSIQYLKRATRSAESETANARAVVEAMLAEIAKNGENAVRDYAAKLDRWTGPIVMTAQDIERRIGAIPGAVPRDIDFATRRVRRFARAQRDSTHEFAVEVQPGLMAGQRLIPINVSGCYVLTGRYAHIASAYMAIATAKA